MSSKIIICAPAPPAIGGIATWSKVLRMELERRCFTEAIFFDTRIPGRSSQKYSLARRLLGGARHGLVNAAHYRKLLASEKPHLVHVNSSGGFGHLRDILFLLLARSYRCKTILHLHFGAGDPGYGWVPGGRALLKMAASAADAVLVLNEQTSTALGTGHSVSVVLNGTPDPGPGLGLKCGKRAVYIGWIIPEKGVFDLVEAWRVAMRDSGWRLDLIGPADADNEARLLAAIDESDAISYLGSMVHKDTSTALARASVFVLPSVTEGLPFVALEAMSHSCCLLVSPVGGLPALFETRLKPGYLVEPSATAIAESLGRLCGNKDDVEQRGEDARALYEQRYTDRHMVDQLLGIWSDTCRQD